MIGYELLDDDLREHSADIGNKLARAVKEALGVGLHLAFGE